MLTASDPARILVADDDDQFRRLVAQLLASSGYLVEEAADAPEALARMSTTAFDLLVADVNMPGNEGLAVLHRQTIVPVVIVTGDPTLETAVFALRGAAVDYLVKPISPTSLLARVAEGVARGRAQRGLTTTESQIRSQLELVMSLLSPREQEVLQAFRAKPRPLEVASTLSISPHTVKNHLKAIFRKLAVGSQAELLVRLAEAERRGR